MKKSPLVIVSSIFIFLTAVAVFVFGFLAFAFSGFGDGVAGALITTAIIALIVFVGLIVVGVQYLKGKNWARIVSLCFSFVWTIPFTYASFAEQDYSNLSLAVPGFVAFILIACTFLVKDGFFRRTDGVVGQ